MAAEETPPLSPKWEKARVASTLIASTLIPLVIAVVGQMYTTTARNNELGARYVEPGPQQLNGMEPRAGGDIENFLFSARLEDIDEELAFAFGTRLPVNQFIPFLDE